jgi:3-hydroxyacyl-[acyl-carrier-protein] dehydratase
MADNNLVMDIQQILELLPHRYPFLLIDRVTQHDPGNTLTGYKNVSYNEPFFQGHFPGQPIMPGVLILEALAQAGVLLVADALDDYDKKLFLFSGIDKAKFRKPVVPGDRLILEVVCTAHKMHIWKMDGKATVDGKIAAQAALTAAVIDKEAM